jgi:hypothetical protein
MVISKGEKVHVIRRRNFADDFRRHFIGEVRECDGWVARVSGYVFIFDQVKGFYHKIGQKRTTIMDLSDSGFIVNIIPPETNVEHIAYKESDEQKLVVTDNKTFSLDINEFGFKR